MAKGAETYIGLFLGAVVVISNHFYLSTNREKIFEKFYRGKSHDRTSGSGLGLAICKGFVEAHGGEISAQNNPGKGITIHFSIPVGSGEDNKHGNQ